MMQIGLAFIKDIQILAGDTSICDAPNIGYTEKQLKELNNPHLNRLKKELIRFRVSCIADTQTDFILTSTITNSKKINEVELALKHLDNLNQRIKHDQHHHNLRERICLF